MTQRLKSFLSTPPPSKAAQLLPTNINLLENVKEFPSEAEFPSDFFSRMVIACSLYLTCWIDALASRCRTSQMMPNSTNNHDLFVSYTATVVRWSSLMQPIKLIKTPRQFMAVSFVHVQITLMSTPSKTYRSTTRKHYIDLTKPISIYARHGSASCPQTTSQGNALASVQVLTPEEYCSR